MSIRTSASNSGIMGIAKDPLTSSLRAPWRTEEAPRISQAVSSPNVEISATEANRSTQVGNDTNVLSNSSSPAFDSATEKSKSDQLGQKKLTLLDAVDQNTTYSFMGEVEQESLDWLHSSKPQPPKLSEITKLEASEPAPPNTEEDDDHSSLSALDEHTLKKETTKNRIAA